MQRSQQKQNMRERTVEQVQRWQVGVSCGVDVSRAASDYVFCLRFVRVSTLTGLCFWPVRICMNISGGLKNGLKILNNNMQTDFRVQHNAEI